MNTRWWQLKYFLMVIPIRGWNFPFWRAYFSKGLVETTNQNTFWNMKLSKKRVPHEILMMDSWCSWSVNERLLGGTKVNCSNAWQCTYIIYLSFYTTRSVHSCWKSLCFFQLNKLSDVGLGFVSWIMLEFVVHLEAILAGSLACFAAEQAGIFKVGLPSGCKNEGRYQIYVRSDFILLYVYLNTAISKISNVNWYRIEPFLFWV